MTETSPGAVRPKTPIHLWIVAIVSLLWNSMGAFDYLATQLEAEFYLGQVTEEQMAYFLAIPAWAVAGWALGVWGAFAGSIGLLLRKAWSTWAFVVSIVGLAISSLYNFGLSNGAEIMGTAGVVFSVIVWIVAILLIVYSRRQTQAGVLT